MGDAIEARTVAIPGANGVRDPGLSGATYGGDRNGWRRRDTPHARVRRRPQGDHPTVGNAFGCAALCPNLYSREAPGADPDDAAAAARARGGVPDDRLVGDVEGGINYLWSLPASNGKAATIGF